MPEKLPRWLTRRGEIYYFKRQVPTRYKAMVGAAVVRISLQTSDLGQAVVARDRINAQTEAFWRALARGDDPTAQERYLAAIERAKLEGFVYEPVDKLRGHSVEALLDRISALEALVAAGACPQAVIDNHPAPPAAAERQAVSALLGREPLPQLTLSTLFDQYEQLTRDERKQKSEGQLHKWRLPHKRALANIVRVVGDKPIAELTRADALAFRSWWVDRVMTGGLAAGSANKDMTHVAKMIATISDRLDLDLTRRFTGLLLDSDQEKRPPFSTQYIRDVLLAGDALGGLNDEARAIVLVMIETGARPIEIAHLLAANIQLDGAIPHIAIEPYQGYTLKTKYSRRQIPLVGVAVQGARILKGGGGRYRDNTGTLSATVNKYLAERKLLETDDHSLYSFRHAFKDRLTAVSAPDILDAALMGHKFDRPDYGRGPTLELKLEWIRKIAITA